MAPPDPSYREVLDAALLPDHSLDIAEVSGRRIGLAKLNGKVFAFDNVCPHLGGSLGRGTLKDGCVVCPLHHWSFDLATGKCLDGMPTEKVAVFETKVEEGKIWVKIIR